MILKLKDFGMIKKASINIDGLCVIAGENDTGKSTVGKALYLVLKSIPSRNNQKNLFNKIGHVGLSMIFKNQILKDASLELIKDEKKYIYDCSEPVLNVSVHEEGILDEEDIDIHEALFIETPLVWDFTNFFSEVAQVESQMNIKLDYPYFIKDLSFKLLIKSSYKNFINLKDKIVQIIGGEFKKDKDGKYFFEKDDKNIELINTATGIKTFAILQVLSQNGWLNKHTMLIFDEPEVHLHPKWQLSLAKIIVELVKNGIKIVITSHSPYMIEALETFAKEENIKNYFYLAKKEGNFSLIENITKDTSVIYDLLAEPFDDLENLQIKSYEW